MAFCCDNPVATDPGERGKRERLFPQTVDPEVVAKMDEDGAGSWVDMKKLGPCL